MEYMVRKEILGLRSYKAGKPISEVKRELGLAEVVKLASNENALGCSPKVKKALRELVEETHMYPDASNHELKDVISAKLGVNPQQIVCSTGSDSLIRVIANTFLEPGDESITAAVTFSRYEDSTKLMGATSIVIPMDNNAIHIEKMVDAITEKTRIIWFCNPNNPTGTIFTKAQFARVINKIPDHVLIIMDEAYNEYVTSEEFPNSLEYLNDYPNMIILRTFSKYYGLASLRCGYGIASEELCSYLNRVIGPFDVNLYAQKAAVAALRDEEFLKLVSETNIAGKKYLYKQFELMNLQYIETNTNFLMVDTKIDDKEVFDKLLLKGIIVRPGHLLGMPRWLRVTIGTLKQNELFIKALKEIL
ncbi:histidinol-phosphate transaminase [Clostridium sp. CM028]|uniref:histidinol-phosphate transaminase n=1 Tax=unclassified Clostridium TaxID=2614128 RepID=UPI001C0B167F|nr:MULTISPECIES: histidinol-phosphate transaminase [unclassified Clostridium]MBU3091739.1 histidinol-phosphate transaminase [Clostridium sp. CF011]MBW9144759.1 histidinol-phosphate transaminase [Clostridium sp. CM027]MBW9149230.1 histidinol-phosphate transaminase [Clostridium sp. CM028]UVE40493.1 histidinol-phosphate transaminase [Clostridium sp. CM027]WAG69448.1 histidinol-phosphate transaminase [Clostridium sp. CF011]